MTYNVFGGNRNQLTNCDPTTTLVCLKAVQVSVRSQCLNGTAPCDSGAGYKTADLLTYLLTQSSRIEEGKLPP